MLFPKKKRIIDRELLQSFSKKRCIICGWVPSDPHHVKTVGSGGDDVESNLLALCRKHHTEIHKIGVRTFFKKYSLKG